MRAWFDDMSELLVLEILLAGVVLFLVLRIVQRGLGVWVIRRQGSPALLRFYPVVEVAVWVMFLSWAVRQIFQPGVAGSVALLVLMVGLFAWAGSFVVRDWFAGVVFKAEETYRLGDLLGVKGVRGRLKHMGYRSLTLEAADGLRVIIPYSAFVKERAVEAFPRKTVCKTVALDLPVQTPFSDARQTLQAIALCAPWSAMDHKPQVRLVESRDHHYTVEVDAYIVDERFAADVEAYIIHHMDL
ncbi:hypothetical protein DSLASN_09200 [Desulfoluna limicola]|uniref:Mechanosensitive ion channel MscS domain-containing protein n=1 Tax=Desulfoluna limicola TaxID=2810562 RepID=A0ABM7PCN3_9BACT|nr:mechanosensitive ion channel domain-containing protein [Desulfoluna limicola]BCS95288.1 hypothetical protein DSLASN_09200 [Desulfoluna limicola]